MTYRGPELLTATHAVSGFACGEPALDQWLSRHAMPSQASGAARTFVAVADAKRVVGYYSLAAAQIEARSAVHRLLKGEPAGRPVPAVLLARLAVDAAHQRLGVGRSLLQHAILSTLTAAEAVGVRALLVHAKDNTARQWYEQFGFDPSPTDALHLQLMLKDARKTLGP